MRINSFYIKLTAFLISVTFAFVALFGLSLSMSKSGMDLIPCAFSQGHTMCPNVSEHLSHWQKTFTVTLVTLYLLIVAVAALVLYFKNDLLYGFTRYFLYAKEHFKKLANYWLALFSQGILQPLK